MSFKIIITPNAVLNIENAIIYYKQNASNKVAKQFIEDYKKTFKDIQKTKYFQVFFEDFRGKSMKKFPFIVFYTINEELRTIVIKAVFNTHQDTTKYPL